MRGTGAAAPTVPVKLRAVDGFPIVLPRAPADDVGMKIIPTIVLLAAFAGDAAAQSIPPSRAADAALIKKEIEIICQAFVDKDRKKLEETHGKNWRGFTPWSGHVIRGLEGYMDEATFAPGTPKGQMSK